jgi:hypothetical protein
MIKTLWSKCLNNETTNNIYSHKNEAKKQKRTREIVAKRFVSEWPTTLVEIGLQENVEIERITTHANSPRHCDYFGLSIHKIIITYLTGLMELRQ